MGSAEEELTALSSIQTEKETKSISSVDCDQMIVKCVKKTVKDYGGSTTDPFMYSFRSRTMLNDLDIPNKPEELEESLDLIFDEASGMVKKAMIVEVMTTFGLGENCRTLKEAFQSARKNSESGNVNI